MRYGRVFSITSPNQEIREVIELGLQYAECTGADLLLIIVLDCDHFGIAARTTEREYQLLTGNEVGLLM